MLRTIIHAVHSGFYPDPPTIHLANNYDNFTLIVMKLLLGGLWLVFMLDTVRNRTKRYAITWISVTASLLVAWFVWVALYRPLPMLGTSLIGFSAPFVIALGFHIYKRYRS